jgi:hypothetical protein
VPRQIQTRQFDAILEQQPPLAGGCCRQVERRRFGSSRNLIEVLLRAFQRIVGVDVSAMTSDAFDGW